MEIDKLILAVLEVGRLIEVVGMMIWQDGMLAQVDGKLAQASLEDYKLVQVSDKLA